MGSSSGAGVGGFLIFFLYVHFGGYTCTDTYLNFVWIFGSYVQLSEFGIQDECTRKKKSCCGKRGVRGGEYFFRSRFIFDRDNSGLLSLIEPEILAFIKQEFLQCRHLTESILVFRD